MRYCSFSTFLILSTASISFSLSSRSKCVITTIKGRLNSLASSMVFVLMFLFSPETTHNAYSGKNEHRLSTTCFSLCPPTSMNDSSLLEFSSQFSIDIMDL